MYTKQILDAITKISRITGTLDIALQGTKAGLVVSGGRGGRLMQITIDETVPLELQALVGKDVLVKTLSARKSMELSSTERHLILSAGKFRTELVVQPFEDLGPETQSAEAVKVTKAQQELIDYSLSVGRLTPIYERAMSFCIDIGPEASRTATLSNLQFCLIEAEGQKATMSGTFPAETFDTVSFAADKSDYTFLTTSSRIMASGRDWALSLPYAQNDLPQTIDDVVDLAKNFGDPNARVSREDLLTVLSAVTGVLVPGEPVELKVTEKSIEVAAHSGRGAVTDSLRAKLLGGGTCQVNIDPDVLIPFVQSCPSEYLEFGTHRDLFFVRGESDVAVVTYCSKLKEF